jgi:predicted MFS family arabinose efflux permease
MLASSWFILAVLFAARFALGYQFQSAGSVAPFLIRDLGISYTQVGLLVGGFILPGIAISLPSGFLGRRFGDKSVVTAGLALMVLGGGIASIAQSYSVILFGHLLAGVGGAILIVLMSKMLADWFADKELFLGNAIFIVGWPAGIAAGQATQSWLADMTSWQFVFRLSTVLAALALVLVAAFYHRPPGLPADTPERPQRLGWQDIKIACLAGIIWMFLNGANLVMLSFGPSYLIEQRGMQIAPAGAVVSLMSWATIVAIPLGGYLATRYRIPNVVMIGGLAVSIVLGAALPFAPYPIVFFTLLGLAFAIAVPVVGSLAAEVFDPRVRGPGFGVYFLWYFGGMPVLIFSAGLLRDWTGSLTATLLYADIMLLCTLLLAIYFRMTQGNRAVRS